MYEVCRTAFFLGINAGELTASDISGKSQEQLFKEKLAGLKADGLSVKQIGRMLGIGHHSVQDAGKTNIRAVHDHSVRKGMRKMDWNRLDEETLPVYILLCLCISFWVSGPFKGHGYSNLLSDMCS